jgi:hypothetical protein
MNARGSSSALSKSGLAAIRKTSVGARVSFIPVYFVEKTKINRPIRTIRRLL